VTPEFSIWPQSNSRISLNVSFLSLKEVTPNGSVVGSLDLHSQYTHIVKPLGDHWYLLTASYLNHDVTIEFALTHVLNDLEVRSDPEHAFFIYANSVKWSMLLSDWPFQSLNNRLRLTTKFDTISPVLRVEDHIYDAEDVTRHIFHTEVSELRITVPSLIRVDQANLIMQNNDFFKYHDRNRTMEFSFPAFRTILRYDPDVTVIDPGDKGIVKQVLSANSLIVFATLGVVFSAVIVTTVILVVIFVVRRRSRLAKQEETWKGINYDEEFGGSPPPIPNEVPKRKDETSSTLTESLEFAERSTARSSASE